MNQIPVNEKITSVHLKAPYLILIGEEDDPTYAKTGFGIVQWRRERVAGQFRFPGCTLDLGVPDMTVEAAVEAGVGSLVVGVAPVGGAIPDAWWHVIESAARSGLDIVCGLHVRLTDNPAIVAAAEESGARLIDVRVPPPDLPVGTGIKRAGKRLLTVASDCAIGKKYTALALDQAMRAAGMKSTFRATGQTGIMIAGEGIPIDAVVADFISGAAELISPENDPDHWDVIEGQGSLLNPSYSGVTLGLLHGSQPDAIILCHDSTRTEILDVFGDYPIPELDEVIDHTLHFARRTRPRCFCAGVSVNTSSMTDLERDSYLGKLQSHLGLPCVDPVATGMSPIANFLLEHTP